MANEGNKGNDFYAVLGLNKECTDSDLRNAYKKLALVRIYNLNTLFFFLSSINSVFA
jgi:preprotein translocase subunit Sec63